MWELPNRKKIKTKNYSILIVCIYNPPKGSPYRWCKQKFEDLTQTLKFLEKETKPKSIIITGDLNFSTTDWIQMSSPDELDNTWLNYFIDENAKFHWFLGVWKIARCPFNPYCYSNVNELLKQWYEEFNRLFDQNVPRVTQHRSQLPPVGVKKHIPWNKKNYQLWNEKQLPIQVLLQAQ